MAVFRAESVLLISLLAMYSLIAYGVQDPIDVFAQLFWRTATTRPPILLILVFGGWAWVSRSCTAAGMSLELVCGRPGGSLRPATVLRATICLLDAVLLCRFLPFVAAGLGSEHWAAWTLVSDLCAYTVCVLALIYPPSKLFGGVPSAESAWAHAKYGGSLAAETGFARNELLEATWDALMAPLAPVTFWHVIVADYATSLAKAFGDVHVTACVASTEIFDAALSSMPQHNIWWNEQRGPCVTSVVNASALALPFWCRLFQCLAVYRRTREQKNLWNALKYATAFPLVLAGYLERIESTPRTRALFVAAAVVQSTATFSWDVFMDWGLFKRQQGGPIFGVFAAEFRPQPSLVFRGVESKSTYALLVAFNLALRFVWALAIFGGSPTRGFGMLAFEAAEILRRTVWALFRIEWEYMHLDLPVTLPKPVQSSSSEEEEEEEDDSEEKSLISSAGKSTEEDLLGLLPTTSPAAQ